MNWFYAEIKRKSDYMKIGIVTIIDYMNYGNRLQNFAVQEVLKLFGCSVETISQRESSRQKFFRIIKRFDIKNYVNLAIVILNKSRLRVFKTKKDIDKQRLLLAKQENFIKFTKEHILETDYKISRNYVPKDIISKYDFIVVGSDQVWNPTSGKISSIEFAGFVPKEKRISYSASFGVSKIPFSYINKFRTGLNSMAYISVREEEGREIIKQLTGKSVPVLIDPTMMLSREEWLNISKSASNKPKQSYLLTYFLGGSTRKRDKWINKIAEKNNLSIVNLASFKDEKNYCISPSEFIDYINDCKLLLTDSFHGIVFSVLFSKPFVVFKRGKINSRINTLLKKFQLENRKWENLRNEEEIFKINFSNIQSILEYERQKAFSYLKKALDLEDV